MSRNTRQIERMASLLRDVRRSGGVDRWDHLRSHGHHFSTVLSAADRGYLRELIDGRYEATEEVDAFFIWYDLWKKVTA